ncbi:MAG: tetratricopeptide repeat protein [Cellvibrionaceae bacterium]
MAKSAYKTNKISTTLLIVFCLALFSCGDDAGQRKAADHVSRSEAYMKQGQFRAAMIEARNAIKVDSGNPANTLALAKVYSSIGANRQIETLLLPMLKNSRDHVGLALAEAYVKLGKFVSARELLETLKVSTPEQGQRVKRLTADVLMLEKNYEAALAVYADLLSEDPNSYHALEGRINVLIQSKQLKAAQQSVEELVTKHKENPSALYLAGYVAYLVNSLELSESHLTNALIYLSETDILLPVKSRVLRLLSRTLTEQGRADEALVYSRLLAEANPDAYSAEQQFSSVMALIQEGKFDEAQAALEELLEENPNSQSAALVLGLVRLEQGELDSAAELLGASIDVETAKSDIISTTVTAQVRAGQAKQALEMLDRALLAKPNDAKLLAMQGLLALNIKDRAKGGARNLQKALSMDPWRVRLRMALAKYYFSVQDSAQGLAQLRQAFKTKPDEWSVTESYLNYLLKTGNTQEAETVITQLAESYPKATKTRFLAAVVDTRTGKKAKAIKGLEALLGDDAYAPARLLLAGLLSESGKLAAGQGQVEQLLEGAPDNMMALRFGTEMTVKAQGVDAGLEWLDGLGADESNILTVKALLLSRQEKFGDALKLVEGVQESASEILKRVAVLVRVQYASQLASEEQFESARQLLNEALSLSVKAKSVRLAMLQLELKAKDYDRADVLVAGLRGDYPNDPGVLMAKVDVLRLSQGVSEAYAYLDKHWSDKLPPRAGLELFRLARANNGRDLDSVFQRWKAIASPKDTLPYITMGQYYQSSGNTPERAIEFYQQALSINGKQPVVLNNLAWLVKEKNIDQAVGYAEKAVSLAPKSAAILDTLGWLLHLKGEKSSAIAKLEKALELAPENKEIAEHLKAVKSS